MSIPNPVSNLINAIKTLNTLKSFVFSGDIAKIIIDPELLAAKEAFEKVKFASDPKQQIWSAINHLEAAHNRLKEIYSRDSYLMDQLTFKERMVEKDKWALCLMATCYKAVDEIDLCQKTLQ